MAKRIIYTNEDGGVSIVVPATNSGLTIEEIAAKDVPNGVPFDIVEDTEIMSDCMFRNAWRKQGRVISEDLASARLIAHEKRRLARDAGMRPLDIQATIPSQARAAEAARAALRTKYERLQTNIDGAATVDDLRPLVAGLDQ